MGKNIALLYMSAYFAQPAPEGSKNRFLRTQTNEAAVSALWKDPASRPDKIVALCSDTVRTKPTVPAADGSGNKVPTLEYFRDEFLKQLGVQPEQLVAVSVPDSMEEADQTRAISAVLEQVAENDNLYFRLYPSLTILEWSSPQGDNKKQPSLQLESDGCFCYNFLSLKMLCCCPVVLCPPGQWLYTLSV